MPDPDMRAVRCPVCDGAGELIYRDCSRDSMDGPGERDVPCPECDGTGRVLEEVEPITLEDLEQITE